jgi:hypothetical protein
VSEVQVLNSFGDVAWLFRVETSGLSFANRTKATVPCTNISSEHERRSAIRPAFEDVWTTSFLANRVEIQSFNQLKDIVLVRRVTQADSQPLGFWLTDFLIIRDYRKFAGQLIYL